MQEMPKRFRVLTPIAIQMLFVSICLSWWNGIDDDGQRPKKRTVKSFEASYKSTQVRVCEQNVAIEDRDRHLMPHFAA